MLDDKSMALELVTATKAVRDASKTSVQKERNARPSGAKVTDNGLIPAAGDAERGLKAIALFDASARVGVTWIQARRADVDQWTKVFDAIVAALHANCADPEADPVTDVEAAHVGSAVSTGWS